MSNSLSQDHPKDAEYLNKPINNYVQMQTIFAYDLATGRFAMGSSEPLGEHSHEYVQTQESETVVLDEEGDNLAAGGSAPPPPPGPLTRSRR